MLDLVWDQWSVLGLFSESKKPFNSVIDPEALISFTLGISRYDARLHDEVISWLAENEHTLNVQRMQNIIKADENIEKSIIAAAAFFLSKKNKSAKWKKIASDKFKGQKSLFLSPSGEVLPVWDEKDEDYIRYGWIRPKTKLRKLSGKIDLFQAPNLIIRLRYLFGINLRAELIAYLLKHETGNPTEISKKLHYSQPTVRQACEEMAKSGIINATQCGKEIQIALDPKRWTDFLRLIEIKNFRWINWPAAFKAFNAILKFLVSKDWENVSEYIQISESRRLIKDLSGELSKINPRLFITDNFSANDKPYLKECVETILKSLLH